MSDMIFGSLSHYLGKKRKIRFAILSVFLGLSISATLLTSFYTYFQMEKVMNITSRDLIDKTQRVIINDTMDYLNPARFIPMISAGLVKRDGQNLIHNLDLDNFLMESLDEFPQIDAFYNGDEQGNALIVGRIGNIRTYAFTSTSPLPNDVIYFVRKINRATTPFQESRFYYNINGEQVAYETRDQGTINFDPRLRPWYQAAKKIQERHWTDIYLYETLDLGLTYAVPVYQNQELINVMSADITVNKISDLLLHQKASRSGINFIVTPEGTLVGYPDSSKIVLTANKQPQIARLEQVGEPSLIAAYQLYQKNHESHLFFTFENIDYIAHFTPFPEASGKDWILGVVVPADDFIGPIKQTSREVWVISLIILAIASIILVIFSHKISYPIERLAGQMHRIRTLDIEEESPIESGLQELSQMDEALRSMKEGLNSFSKFVPKVLVQRMIASGQEAKLGGERKRLTFLFSDIEGFTSISERIPSDILIKHLSEYLSELSTIIIHHYGTIDKYIGDSIMAFWGAPERDEQQIYHACQSVWLCSRRLHDLNVEWAKQGRPIMRTRFGLHQGEAIVGNVGSADRLNYTVIGDNVNLGSRLEGINKMYGTSIIASETVYEKAKDKFLFRLLDKVAVKGKDKGIKIYEMIGKYNDTSGMSVTAEDISRSVKTQVAFETYMKQQWQDAERMYRELLDENSKDHIAAMYLERLTEFKKNPPPLDWGGVNHLHSK
ncbi:MAG: adenylate/guanylate cyclase domain-containing protein [Janthinobacterium lividum]